MLQPEPAEGGPVLEKLLSGVMVSVAACVVGTAVVGGNSAVGTAVVVKSGTAVVPVSKPAGRVGGNV